MPRQVLPLVDLRTPEQRRGLSRSQRNIQAITGILQTLGAAEQVRRERQQLDTITRAIAGGSTTIEAINAAVNEAKKTQFGTGLQGVLQRIGGAFQPSPSGGIGQSIQQMIIGQRLKQALMPKFQIPSGFETSGVTVGPEGGVTRRFAKPTAPKAKIFTVTERPKLAEGIKQAVKNVPKRDIAGIGKGQIRNVRFQKDLIAAYVDFMNSAGYSTLSTAQQKQLDTLWDAEMKIGVAPRKQRDSAGNIIKVGWNPNSPEVKQARKELRAGKTTAIETPDEIAPAGLEDVWGTLSDEEKETAKRALAAGRTVDEIKALL